ncbi:hypothetical protein H0H93_010226 [Arthromyces matolae]|nr:hypothetical protein H0H93_010226 [Arthromyces matolae]
MSSLSDQIDRLSRNTRAIRATTAHFNAPVSGPFTRAILSTHLGDLIRDVDLSELGLFSLPESESQITRAEFTGATPLKKASSRREDVFKTKEIDPEVYAHAALKCIDRYNTIRPMPRANQQVATILEHLEIVRRNIQSLTEMLQQSQVVESPPLKYLISKEETRIQDLQSRLRQLQDRRKTASSATSSASHAISSMSRAISQSPPSPHEESLWDTRTSTASTARTLRFTDNVNESSDILLTEEVDFDDMVDISITSPVPVSKMSSLTSSDDSPAPSAEEYLDIPRFFKAKPHNYEAAGKVEVETTVTPARQTSATPPIQLTLQRNTDSNGDASSQAKDLNVKQDESKLTSEIERIVARIWTTMGDTIITGSTSSQFQENAGNVFPQAKETMFHLQSVSTMSPSSVSPSHSSTSSISRRASPPTSQQILTAHLLHTLLANPPHFSLPLNTVKDLLAEKASSSGGVGAASTTRILYGCVAKRLLRIDRSGGEQIVKFDF